LAARLRQAGIACLTTQLDGGMAFVHRVLLALLSAGLLALCFEPFNLDNLIFAKE